MRIALLVAIVLAVTAPLHAASTPRSRGAALERAQQLLWQQHYAEAAAIYRDLLRERPDDVDARKGLATAAYWSGDFRAAQRDYRLVLAASPNDADARRALDEIASASQPLVAGDSEFMSDDQPLRRFRTNVAYTFFSDPLTTWTASAGTYALDANRNATAPFASIGASTALPALHLRVSGALRGFRFPDGETKALGGVTLAHEWRRSVTSLTIDRHELLYTASSIDSHPYETTATLRWTRGTEAMSSAAALHATRYFDRNSGRGADAYHLMRVAHTTRASLSLGAAGAYRDTDETRLRFIGNDRRYDPYWTPELLLEARAVAAARVSAGRTTLDLHADGGWARDRELGVRRTFHPWRGSAALTFPLSRAFHGVVAIERQSTVFYRADSIRVSFTGRL